MSFVLRVASVLAVIVVAASAGAASVVHAAEESWPERVVSMDKMSFTAPLKIHVPSPGAVDRSKTSSLVLHIFVDEQGVPVRQRIEQSSGNPNLDEAVLHAVRTARFKPFVEDGKPLPVTVVAPMHFPFKERPR